MRLILALIFLSMASTVMAGLDDYSNLTDDDIDLCSDVQDLAIEVMHERQSGVKFMDAIKAAKQEENEHRRTFRMEMVNKVYEIPVLPIQSQQEEMTATFGNSVAKGCLEAALKEKTAFEGALLDEEAREQAASADKLQTQLQQYIMQIDQAVENNWIRPATTNKEQSCEVIVTQTMSGDVIDVQLQSCTDDKDFQRSVERAVRKASPLPLPPDPELFDRKIQFTFKH